MQNDMQRMEVIANNAANALTPGFKRELVAASASLGVSAAGAASAATAGVPLEYRVVDTASGAPKKTSNPLDVALLGDGLFEVRTDRGMAYTRLGAFRVDEQGRLVTQAGFPVQGTSGDIVLSSPNPVIDLQGKIFEKGAQVAQLKVATFDRSTQLRRAGGGLLFSSGNALPAEASLPRVTQGHLESSNVDSAREMAGLMETYRHFESSNRLLQAYDEMRDKAFRSLGQF
ncbi:MAG: flagellar hook basal-body protein [Rhodocyclales bacterium]|nr:flagellar hook basal-body protein [Rhodocyclales bacterium]